MKGLEYILLGNNVRRPVKQELKKEELHEAAVSPGPGDFVFTHFFSDF